MCFTHEDEENPRKQLVKIAGHLDDVTSRLNRIENGVSAMAGSTGRMSGNLSSRRRSSAKSRFAQSVTGGTAVLSVHNEEPEAESVVVRMWLSCHSYHFRRLFMFSVEPAGG